MPGTAGQDVSPRLMASLVRLYSVVVRGGLVIRDLLRMLDCTTVLQAGGDAGRAEGVTAGRVWQSSLASATFDHSQHLQPVQPPLG